MSFLENEIKYILDPDHIPADCPEGWQRYHIRQGYIEGNRIRDKQGRYFFTYKRWLEEEQMRVEVETEIDQATFERLWPHCSRHLYKTRDVLPSETPIEWVIDRLYEQGADQPYFILAEVEMPPDQTQPDHIPQIVRDALLYEAVLGDARFENYALADPDHARALLNALSHSGS